MSFATWTRHEWKQLRLLRRVSLLLTFAVPFVLLAGAAASQRGWMPGTPLRVWDARTVLYDAAPLVLAAVWGLVAALAAGQVFAGGRATGTEWLVRSLPVRRAVVWFARGTAALATAVVVAVLSLAFLLAVASFATGSAPTLGWSSGATVGGFAIVLSMLGTAAIAPMLRQPFQAALLSDIQSWATARQRLNHTLSLRREACEREQRTLVSQVKRAEADIAAIEAVVVTRQQKLAQCRKQRAREADFRTRLADADLFTAFIQHQSGCFLEQLKGADIDRRADLYAVGATMHRLLAGHRLHDVEAEEELARKILTEPAPPLADVVEGAPEAVCRIVDRALAFLAARRYPDAKTMLLDVRAAREGDEPP